MAARVCKRFVQIGIHHPHMTQIKHGAITSLQLKCAQMIHGNASDSKKMLNKAFGAQIFAFGDEQLCCSVFV